MQEVLARIRSADHGKRAGLTRPMMMAGMLKACMEVTAAMGVTGDSRSSSRLKYSSTNRTPAEQQSVRLRRVQTSAPFRRPTDLPEPLLPPYFWMRKPMVTVCSMRKRASPQELRRHSASVTDHHTNASSHSVCVPPPEREAVGDAVRHGAGDGQQLQQHGLEAQPLSALRRHQL